MSDAVVIHNDQTRGHAYSHKFERVLEEARNLGPHDLGAVAAASVSGGVKMKDDQRDYQHWEKSVHAALSLLVRKQHLSVDELRSGVERLEPALYASLSYYERWTCAIITNLIERRLLSREDIEREYAEFNLDEKSGTAAASSPSVFAIGDDVVVKPEALHRRWRKPHLRVPGYIFGAQGTVVGIIGSFLDPSYAAFRDLTVASSAAGGKTAGTASTPYEQRLRQPLYRVKFAASQIRHYAVDMQQQQHHHHDSEKQQAQLDYIYLDVFHPWLSPAPAATATAAAADGGGITKLNTAPLKLVVEHDGHTHGSRREIETTAVDRESKEVFPLQPLAELLIHLLVKKGLITLAEIHTVIQRLDLLTGSPLLGQRLVVRAWTNCGFKELLLRDAPAAAKQLGIEASNYPTNNVDVSTHPSSSTKVSHRDHQHHPPTPYPHGHTVFSVVENSDTIHNLIVCTLCSCYPSSILGMSPDFYKSATFRARSVLAPRKMLLEEFGLDVGQKEIHVHDSTAEARYMVLPQRPAGTDGWSEERLMEIVSRNSLIGVAVVETQSNTSSDGLHSKL